MKVVGRNSDAGGGSAMNGGESTPTSSVQGLGATVRITKGTGEKRGSGEGQGWAKKVAGG